MRHHCTLKQVAHSLDSAQNWNYETDSGVSSSRQSRESAGQSDRKELVQLYSAAAGQEIAQPEKIHGFLEKTKARQIFTAFASSAGSSPSPSARIAPIKSFHFLNGGFHAPLPAAPSLVFQLRHLLAGGPSVAPRASRRISLRLCGHLS